MIKICFNEGWTCRHLDAPGPGHPVTIPHDAMLAEKRTELAPSGINGAWFEGYDYLYEKHFTPGPELAGKRLVLEFEGVYRKAEVHVNGQKLAFRPYGYTNFYVDVTDRLESGRDNLIQVISRTADQPNSRWYSGAGIYRPVHLWVSEQEHILLNGKSTDGKERLKELIFAGGTKYEEGDNSYFENKLDPNALAIIVFTSGTTGKGKGVMLTQKMLLSNIAEGLKYIDVTEKSIALLPLHHTFGSTINVLGHLSKGAELYLSMGTRYVLKELKAEKPTHLVLVPLYLETFYRKIMANIKDKGKEAVVANMMKVSNGLRKVGIDRRRVFFKDILEAFGGKLQFVISGGAPISQELIDAFDAWGVTVINGYGITECAPLISVNRNKKQVKGSVGFVLPSDEVKIADPNDNGEGEIRVKGPNVMLGYYRDEAATADVFDEEGYFRTGDFGRLDSDGALYITGRLKNLIILSNGKNVYPEEIEKVFAAVPGVQDAIVYEGQSARGLEHNAIVLEIFPDAEYCKANGVEDMHAHMQKYIDEYNRIAVPYKKVGILKVRTEDFPKNTLRKIQRFKIDKTID